MDLRTEMTRRLSDAGTSWGMGTFGALAEFHREADERTVSDDNASTTLATAKGAIRLTLPDRASALAYEMLSANPRRWSHGIALCLPEDEAIMSQRQAVTELGPDADAIRDKDREAILFDMGLSVLGPACRQVDFCVRTSDPVLLATLRSAKGQSIFDPACSAMAGVLELHPHRVALTRLGRVEVYQPIGGPATGGVSPAGPHTHVLPKLLAAGRTHSSNTPVPEGHVPCAWVYPDSPVATGLGEDKPYDAGLHDAFEHDLKLWGAPDYVETKIRVRDAINSGSSPDAIDIADTRLQRTGVRIALRQLACQAETDESQALIQSWRAHYDASSVEEDPLEAEHGDSADTLLADARAEMPRSVLFTVNTD